VPNLVSFVASTAELAHGEVISYSINQSIAHSPSLFDAPGTEACASEKTFNWLTQRCLHYPKLLATQTTWIKITKCLHDGIP